MGDISWIAIDWGTTHLRAYAMDANNQILAQTQSSAGMGSLQQHQFEAVLLAAINDWLPAEPTTQPIPVLACGMVGARQGWVEADYRPTPCPACSGIELTQVNTHDKRLNVRILPGLCQHQPADVMRGEETQITGLLATAKTPIKTVCLPGTHSKWVALNGDKIQHFTTFMTGELFALLSKQSILHHSIASDSGNDTNGWDDNAFLQAVHDSTTKPQDLLNNTFKIRATGLLHDTTSAFAVAYLSGLLIGTELAGAREYWSQQTVALIGELELAALYGKALASLGISTHIYPPEKMTTAGLGQTMQALTLTPSNN